MKTGVIISGIAHVGVLGWSLFALPSPVALEAPEVDALPVELISISELSQKRQGDLKAEPDVEVPTQIEPVPEKPAEVDKPAEEPVKEPAPKVVEAPKPPAQSEPEPEPVPEPVVEPEPTPEPEPIPEPESEPEPKQEEAPKPVPVKFSGAPQPMSRPKPPAPVAPKAPDQEKFDGDKIAALLDQTTPKGSTAPVEPQQQGVQNGDQSNQLTANEIDYLRSQFARCWNLQAGSRDAQNFAVHVQMVLNIDGTIAGIPRVLNPGGSQQHKVAEERALRAVQICAPYYYLPQDKYDTWQVIEFVFDPRRMFQG